MQLPKRAGIQQAQRRTTTDGYLLVIRKPRTLCYTSHISDGESTLQTSCGLVGL